MPDICKTDLQKMVSYLDDAAKLYDALPMQMCKCRAHMITQLTNKIKPKLNEKKSTDSRVGSFRKTAPLNGGKGR